MQRLGGAKLMLIRTDNPVADFERYDAEQQALMDKLPRCSECDACIQSDTCYRINDEIICEDCIEHYKVYVDDL